MQKTILSFGELLWDILPDCRKMGGAPFNFTYRANSLGDNGLMISRLGHDELGREAYDSVKALGMDTVFLQHDERYPTGTVQVSFDEENNPDYVIIPDVAYDHIEITNTLLQTAAKTDCLCFGSLAQRSPQSRATLAKLLDAGSKALKFFDINLRKDCYNFDIIRFSLSQADVLKLNEDEAHQLGEMLQIPHKTIPEFCKAIIQACSLQYCLVTLADYGAFAGSNAGVQLYVPGYQVELADSLGAGDAFSAGFIYQLLRGASLGDSCRFGNILGGIVATQVGATGKIADGAVDAFLQMGYQRRSHSELEKYIFQNYFD